MTTRSKLRLLVPALLLAVLLVWWLWLTTPSGSGVQADPVSPATTSAAPPRQVAPAPMMPLQLAPVAVARDPEAGAGVFAGSVVAADSRLPIAGAELTFLRQGMAHSVVSDGQGRFELRCPQPGSYELAAVVRDGYVPFAPHWGHSPIRFEARAGLRVEEAVVYLTPSLIVGGIVVDTTGAPIDGASVRARGDRTLASDLLPQPAATTTSKDGRFQLELGADALVEARHPDYATQAVRARDDMRIVLLPADSALAGGRIEGTVVDPDGQPIEGALIDAYADVPPGEALDGLAVPALVVSDVGGRFSLVDLEHRPHNLVVEARGYATVLRAGVPVDAAPITVQLEGGAAIVGTVVDAENGAPVPAFTIVLDGYVSERSRQRGPALTSDSRSLAFFDPDGRFRIDGLGQEAYRLRAVAWGYGPSKRLRVSLQEPGAAPVEVELELSRGSRVFGKVVDEETRVPLAGAAVWWEGTVRADDGPFPMTARAVSDAGGSFELYGVAGGLRSITAAAEGHHTRIFPGNEAESAGDLGPLTLALAPVAEGEEKQLELTGIGAQLGPTAEGLRVHGVWPSGGAAEAGLTEGDLIIAIDGRPVEGISLGDAVELIRGREDTAVQLSIMRQGSEEASELVVIRRRIRG